MTDEQTQLFEFLTTLSEEARKERLKQFSEYTKMQYDLYAAYKNAGFTPKQALEMVKHLIEISIRNQK